MNLSTKSKIAAAGVLSKGIRMGRNFFGLDNDAVFKRNNIRWQLDLAQGIDFAIFLQGGFEPSTIRSYKNHVGRGSVVLDIGANIGAHTLPLASLVGDTGKVIAFEPTDYAFTKLMKNLELNPELSVRTIPVQAMLAANPGQAKPDSIPSSWSLEREAHRDVHPVHVGTFQALKRAIVLKLDDWYQLNPLERLDFVKIDVDGYEIDVLEGGVNLFSIHSPVIMMEFAPYLFEERGRSFSELLQMLKDLDYQCRMISGSEVLLDSSLLRHIPKGGSINVILRKR